MASCLILVVTLLHLYTHTVPLALIVATKLSRGEEG